MPTIFYPKIYKNVSIALGISDEDYNILRYCIEGAYTISDIVKMDKLSWNKVVKIIKKYERKGWIVIDYTGDEPEFQPLKVKSKKIVSKIGKFFDEITFNPDDQIIDLCNGERTIKEITKEMDLPLKYIKKVINRAKREGRVIYYPKVPLKKDSKSDIKDIYKKDVFQIEYTVEQKYISPVVQKPIPEMVLKPIPIIEPPLKKKKADIFKYKDRTIQLKKFLKIDPKIAKVLIDKSDSFKIKEKRIINYKEYMVDLLFYIGAFEFLIFILDDDEKYEYIDMLNDLNYFLQNSVQHSLLSILFILVYEDLEYKLFANNDVIIGPDDVDKLSNYLDMFRM
jgi:predicted transcriptional regulator